MLLKKCSVGFRNTRKTFDSSRIKSVNVKIAVSRKPNLRFQSDKIMCTKCFIVECEIDVYQVIRTGGALVVRTVSRGIWSPNPSFALKSVKL